MMKALNNNANPLESLLQQHCPNGVEFRELGKLGEFSNTGVDKKKNEKEKEVILLNFVDVMKNHYIDEKIPTMIVTASDNKIKQCTCEKGDIFITPSSETIDEIGFASVITKTLSNTCYSYHIMRYRLFEKQITTSFFIRYLFESEIIRQQIRKYATGLTRFGLKKTKWEQIKIPIPPLEIQQKIVEILDAFTELQAELHARRKQYEYYRNNLLSFEELQRRTDMLNGGGLKLVTLGEIGTFTRGNGLTKSDFVEVGVPCIHYGQIHTHYHNYTHSTTSFVSEEKARKLKKAKCGDLVIAGVSEDKDCVCKAVVYLGKQEACVSGDTFIFSHSQNPKFIGYMFQTENFNTFKHKYAQGAKVLRVHNKHLENFQIPLPPLAVQNDIVELLDKFDTLANDLSTGIPAEIEARQKQYEHYREQLLSFREKCE